MLYKGSVIGLPKAFNAINHELLYYFSIISDHFLVHHILQSNGNKNVVRAIQHVWCFHLERYDKTIKIVYYVNILTLPSNQ